ncbi:Mg-chelatase subunit ChlD-like protein [Caballeronia humi]|uniref:Mg-chelatase subunit ChlD-like protein n=1 Tax=Caballeronia humi TaxID=326474 RepID=A0A158FEV3_9BURK|nr:VWA domain-containing protein [Caballeronia humi]SAL18466.1 Mg-chelatase subunit ChlD-like protein [Caballeronia humi]
MHAKLNAPLDREHLRFRRKRGDAAALHCFVLDCSGSMLAGKRLALAKGLLVALFDRAYRERAEVALVCFGGGRAEVRRQPGAAHWWNEHWVAPIGGGGGTPLALGVRAAGNVLARAARRKPSQARWLWLLTDGRTRDTPERPADADRVFIVDFENEAVRLGRCESLALAWDAEYGSADHFAYSYQRGV